MLIVPRLTGISYKASLKMYYTSEFLVGPKWNVLFEMTAWSSTMGRAFYGYFKMSTTVEHERNKFVSVEKTLRALNYRQLRMAESGRRRLPKGRAHQ